MNSVRSHPSVNRQADSLIIQNKEAKVEERGLSPPGELIA